MAGSLALTGCALIPDDLKERHNHLPTAASASPTISPEQQERLDAAKALSDAAEQVAVAILQDAANKDQSHVVVNGGYGGSNFDFLNENNDAAIDSTLPRIVFEDRINASRIRIAEQDPYFPTNQDVQTRVFNGIELMFATTGPNGVDDLVSAGKQPEIQDFIDAVNGGSLSVVNIKLDYPVATNADGSIVSMTEIMEQQPDGTYVYTKVSDDPNTPAAVEPAQDASGFIGQMQSLQRTMHNGVVNYHG
jgi:hypothetical protein